MRKKRGIHLAVFDYERAFSLLNRDPIMVNDFDISVEAERERLNSIIYTTTGGDTLSNMPMCDCQAMKGEDRIGLYHEACRSYVLPITEKPLESTVWIQTPNGIPAFFNLTVWRILRKNMTYSGFSFLEYLTNPYYTCSNKTPVAQMRKIEKIGIPRSYAHFVDNYDEIIRKLDEVNFFSGNAIRRKKTYNFLVRYRYCTFSKVLPFPSKVGFVNEENNKRKSADPKMAPAVEAIWIIAGIYKRAGAKTGEDLYVEEPPMAKKESRVVRAMCCLETFYKEFEREIAFKKPGISRKLVYGNRPHWTWRGVIVSMQKPHRYDDITLPYSLSVLLFQSHLMNKLLRRRMSPNEILGFLMENTLQYHPLMEQLLKTLISESPDQRIYSIMGRNPTLTQGSINRVGIPEIDMNPRSNVVGISPLNLKNKNADFDGDALYGELCLDNRSAERNDRLSPWTSTMARHSPFTLSRNIALPSTLVSTMTSWLLEGDEISV